MVKAKEAICFAQAKKKNIFAVKVQQDVEDVYVQLTSRTVVRIAIMVESREDGIFPRHIVGTAGKAGV